MCLCTAKRTRDVAVLLLTLTGLNQPYAPEQLELLRSPPNNSTTDTLAKCGTNDLFFKSHTWVNCLTPDACTPPFFNLEGGICDRSSCETIRSSALRGTRTRATRPSTSPALRISLTTATPTLTGASCP